MAAPAHPGQEPQSAPSVLMVQPASFGFNQQTAASNAFQRSGNSKRTREAQKSALSEFDGVATALQRAGIEVLVVPDTPQPEKPDAIFPNNWVSFHFDGTVALYPMLAPNRRWERRDDVLEHVVRTGHFHVARTVDLTHREAEGKYLEGTGSVVLDRVHRVAYASLSPRTDLDVLGEFAQLLDYELVTFETHDAAGRPVYHTNVVMAIGTGFAAACGAAMLPPHRAAVLKKLRAAGRKVVDLSLEQMQKFAGNILELATAGGPVIVLSATALGALKPAQRRSLESYGELLTVTIPTIERIGGGGVRCMLAEVHLPKRRLMS